MLPRLLDVVAQSVWDIDSQDEYDDFESVTDKYQVTSSYMHKVWQAGWNLEECFAKERINDLHL